MGYLLGIVDPHGNLELDCAPIPDDPKNDSSIENDSSTESPNNPLCSWTYSIYKELSQGSWASKNVQAQIQSNSKLIYLPDKLLQNFTVQFFYLQPTP